MEEKVQEGRILTFDKGVEALTIQELESTVEAKQLGGLPKSRPVEHFNFFREIEDIFGTAGYKPLIEQVFSSSGSSGKYARTIKLHEEKYGEKNVQAFALDRINGKIVFQDDALKQKSCGSAIALSFTDMGLEVAYGQNVWACNNMSIFGEHHLKTFGNNKISYAHMKDTLKGWANELTDIAKRDVGYMKKMKETIISENEVPKLFGQLMLMANKNNIDSSFVSPFNISQVNKIAKNYIVEHERKESPATLFDLYNMGTELFNAHHNIDYSTILTQNAKFGNFMVKEYGLNA